MFPRVMLAVFFTIFPLGVGLAVLSFLWFGSFDEFGSPPLFFRVIGSLIGAAFVAFGAALVYGTLRLRGPSSLVTDAARLTRDAPDRFAAGTSHYECPRCGAPLAGSSDVSPTGDAKCHHCGSWFNIRRD